MTPPQVRRCCTSAFIIVISELELPASPALIFKVLSLGLKCHSEQLSKTPSFRIQAW